MLRRFLGGAKHNSRCVVMLSNENRDSAAFRVSSSCWSASRQAFVGAAERSVRLGGCEVALNVEGVAGALIAFPNGATIPQPAGTIALVVFAATRTALVLRPATDQAPIWI
jgi:hypothetical protein